MHIAYPGIKRQRVNDITIHKYSLAYSQECSVCVRIFIQWHRKTVRVKSATSLARRVPECQRMPNHQRQASALNTLGSRATQHHRDTALTRGTRRGLSSTARRRKGGAQ